MGGLCSAGEGAVPDGPKRRGVNTTPKTRKLSSHERSDNDADAGGDSDLDALPPLPKELPNRFQQDTKPSGADQLAPQPSSVSNQASDTPEVERNTSVLLTSAEAESAPAQAAAPKTSVSPKLHPSDSEKLRAIQRSDTNASSASSMSDRRGSPYPQDLTPPVKPQRTPTMSPLVESSLSLSPMVEENMDEEEEAPPRQRSLSADAVKFVPGKASHTQPRRLSADAPTFVPTATKRRLSADAPSFQPAKENTPVNTPTVSTEVAFTTEVSTDAACDDKTSSAIPEATREVLEAACNQKRCVFLRIPGYPRNGTGRGYKNPDDYSKTVGRITDVLLTLETQPSSVSFPERARIGFVCFDSQEDAQAAIPQLSSCHLDGHQDSQLRVDMARPKGPRRGPTRTGNRRGRGGNRRGHGRGRGRGRGRTYRGNY